MFGISFFERDMEMNKVVTTLPLSVVESSTRFPKHLYHCILTLMLSSIPLTVLGQAGTRGWDADGGSGGGGIGGILFFVLVLWFLLRNDK
jgi:hypothetical protein